MVGSVAPCNHESNAPAIASNRSREATNSLLPPILFYHRKNTLIAASLSQVSSSFSVICSSIPKLSSNSLSVFRPRGVPGPTSKLLSRVPAQMGRRETKHEGGRNSKRGNPRPSCCPAPRSGALAVGGLQASARERERLSASPFSRAANLLVREPWTFLL
jgi:hypothetical protein